MSLNVFTQSYRELHWPVFRCTLVLLGQAGLILLAFPVLDHFFDLDWLSSHSSASLLFGYEPGFLRLSQVSDWLDAAGFGLFFPLAMAVYACMMGSWLVAGEEERGSLGLLLAAPLARWRFMLEKSAVLVVVILRPVLVLGLALFVLSRMGIAVSNLTNRVAGLFLLALLFGALALALGSFSGRRRFSLGVALVGLVLAFAVRRLPAGQVLRLISPVYHYEAGAGSPVFLLALLGLALCFIGVGWAGFEHRDLAV
jgi:ABC-2 type transport system permease protein